MPSQTSGAATTASFSFSDDATASTASSAPGPASPDAAINLNTTTGRPHFIPRRLRTVAPFGGAAAAGVVNGNGSATTSTRTLPSVGSTAVRRTQSERKRSKGPVPPPLPRLAHESRLLSESSSDAVGGGASVYIDGGHPGGLVAAGGAQVLEGMDDPGGNRGPPAIVPRSRSLLPGLGVSASKERSIFRGADADADADAGLPRQRSVNQERAVQFWFSGEDSEGDAEADKSAELDALIERDRRRIMRATGGGGRGKGKGGQGCGRGLVLDDTSASNTTQRSALTTGSIDTEKRSNRGGDHAQPHLRSSVRDLFISSRIRHTHEEGDAPVIRVPKLVKSTQTKIKKALKGDSPLRKRLGSDSSPRAHSDLLRPVQKPPTTEAKEDAAIRSRLDGLDLIDLGCARLVSIGSADAPSTALTHEPWMMVRDMLRASGGRAYPEMLLEGASSSSKDRWAVRIDEGRTEEYMTSARPEASDNSKNRRCHPNSVEGTFFSGKDNWTVRIDEEKSTENGNEKYAKSVPNDDTMKVLDWSDFLPCYNPFGPPQLKPTEDESEGDQDSDVGEVGNIFLSQIWGIDQSPPPDVVARIELSKQNKKNAKADMVVTSIVADNCPLDIDENEYIIGTPEQLHPIHEVAGEVLKRGSLRQALDIFVEILHNLERQNEEENDHSFLLIGSTYHNMANIHLWMGEFDKARHCMEESIKKRTLCLPKGHPLLAVSFAKLGISHFALENMDTAISYFEKALGVLRKCLSHDTLEMAKLLGNIGCCYYQISDFPIALKYFTAAFDIQTIWLEGRIQRGNIIYDSGVTLSNMGRLYEYIGDAPSSLYFYEEALLLQASCFAKDHRCITQTLGSLAFVKNKCGDSAAALKIYKNLARQFANHGVSNKASIEVESLIGEIHLQQNLFGDALRCFTHVLKWHQSQHPGDHPSVEETKMTIQNIYSELEKVTV